MTAAEHVVLTRTGDVDHWAIPPAHRSPETPGATVWALPVMRKDGAPTEVTVLPIEMAEKLLKLAGYRLISGTHAVDVYWTEQLPSLQARRRAAYEETHS